jgi:hypothetical protein
MEPKMSSTERALDVLFQAPLGEFTAARQRLVDKLRRQGKAAPARRIADIKKPTLSAWAVNQLRFQEPEPCKRLAKLGAELRQIYSSHARGSSSEKRGKLQADLKQVIGSLAEKASRILSEHGHAASAGTLGRVTSTLHALALRATDEDRRAGRLSTDVAPPGLENLTDLPDLEELEASAPKPAKGAARAQRPARDKAGDAKRRREQRKREQLRKKARAELHAAERALQQRMRDKKAAARKLDEAQQALQAAEARESAAQKDVERARAALQAGVSKPR